MVAERARLFETHQKREYMDETDVTGLKLLSQLGVWAGWLAGWLAGTRWRFQHPAYPWEAQLFVNTR